MTAIASPSLGVTTHTVRPAGFDRIRDQIITSWRAGKRIRVEDFGDDLSAGGATDDDWHELILTEIRARRDRGESPTEAEYSTRFPDQAARLHVYFDEAITYRMARSGVQPATAKPSPATVHVPGYELLEVLGRGGMGVVYKARQIKLNRLVALKMVLAGRYAPQEDLERFYREAEAVAALSHPNIVQVHEVGEHDGHPYFSLEYVHGGTLADRLKGGPLPSIEVARIAQAVARAAQAAHDHDIVHRDLKPANILMSKPDESRDTEELKATQLAAHMTQSTFGVPKVTDFGIAKRLNEAHKLTATGVAAGTPQYMAPEQALADRNRPVGPAADVYAVGVVIYEMLTGRPPFDGDNPVEVMKRVVSDSPLAPSRLNSSVPRDLETICLKCLEKDSQRRYLSAAALADDLSRWLRGKPIAARPVGRIAQGWRWCRRNPTVASLLAGIMLALVSGACVAGVLAVRANEFAYAAERNAHIAHANADRARQNANDAERQAHESREHAAEAKANEVRANEARAEEERLRREADVRERRRSHELYAAQMTVGLAAWESGHVANTRAILEKYRPESPGDPDIRSFEWYYLSRLVRPFVASMNTKPRPVAASFVPKSPGWAVVTGRSIVFSREPALGRTPAWRSPHAADLTDVAFTRDGKIMACMVYGPELHLMNRAGYRPLRTIRLHDSADFRAVGAAFSTDGKTIYVAIGSDTQRTLPAAIAAFDVASGNEIRRYEGMVGPLRSMSLSSDGTKIAAGGPSGELRIWDVESGKQLRRLTPPAGVCSVGFSPDCSLLVAGTTQGSVAIWEVESGRLLRHMRGHLDWLDHLTFASDGRRLATAAADGVIRVWDPTTGEEVRAFRGHERQVTALAFSEDGKQLLSTSDDGAVLVWDANRDQAAVTRDLSFPHGISVLPLPDDRRAVVVHNWCGYQMLDLRTGELSAEVRPKGLKANAFDAALSPDGKTLAIQTHQMGVHLASIEDPSSDPRSVPDTMDAGAVAFSPDGQWLATGYFNGRVVVHSVDGKVPARQLCNLRQAVFAVAFDPADSNRLGTVCRDGTIRIWNHKTGEETLTLEAREHIPVHLVFSPDGQRIATAGGGDHVARLWDTKSGRLLRKFEGHTRNVECLAFTGDGRRLATGSHDLNIKVWDVDTGLPTLTLRGHTRMVKRVAFDRHGTTLMSVGGAQVKIWDGHPAYLYEQGRMLSMGARIRQSQAEWTPETGVRGTFRLVNESGRKLAVPPVTSLNSRVRVFITVERLGLDPIVPAIRHIRPDLRDQYSIAATEVMPAEGVMASGAFVDGKFAFMTAGWPSGKYRVHLEHGWPGDRMTITPASCDFVITD